MLDEYISGDGTDLKIVSSGDIDITGDTDIVGGLSSTQATTLASSAGVTTIGSTTGATVSADGIININNTTEATTQVMVLYKPMVVYLLLKKTVIGGSLTSSKATTLASGEGVTTIGSSSSGCRNCYHGFFYSSNSFCHRYNKC